MVTPHISVVHVPVNAIGKNKSSVFCLPKLSLNFTCFGPSAALVESVKSGAFVPTRSAIISFDQFLKRDFIIETACAWSKALQRVNIERAWNFCGGLWRSCSWRPDCSVRFCRYFPARPLSSLPQSFIASCSVRRRASAGAQSSPSSYSR